MIQCFHKVKIRQTDRSYSMRYFLIIHSIFIINIQTWSRWMFVSICSQWQGFVFILFKFKFKFKPQAQNRTNYLALALYINHLSGTTWRTPLLLNKKTCSYCTVPDKVNVNSTKFFSTDVWCCFILYLKLHVLLSRACTQYSQEAELLTRICARFKTVLRNSGLQVQ